MTADSSSMESSDPATPDTSVDLNSTANRRKSGRARQKPVLLNKDPNIPQVSSSSSGKRKRADARAEEVGEPTDTEEEDSRNDESDPDEEELKEKRRKTRRSKKTSNKPAAKKPKTGPTLTTNLAVRPAVNGAKKSTKPKQPRARPIKKIADAGTGLFGQSNLSPLKHMLMLRSRDICPRPHPGCCRSRLDCAMGAKQCRSHA